ncbi:hypothetical protein [Streptomyces niveus]|uniref:hypothetical protein n=1 Tax=Streptomyces niveus TaxID=193462 RepID=UPI0036D30A67
MTQTPAASTQVRTPAPAQAAPPGRGVRALRAVAIASCLPYITLKVVWIAGGRIGVPDGSTLLEHRTMMAVVNSVSVLLDGAVVVLALLLTQSWGRRVPAWLIGLPMWAATGLLAPIMTGYPLQLAGSLVDGSRPAPSNSEPFLATWVFAVVYSGFILQGLTLGTLFVLYARRRWGHLWRGSLGDAGTTRACFESSVVHPKGGAHGVRCVRSQGGGSALWMDRPYSGDSDNAASVRARRPEPDGTFTTRPRAARATAAAGAVLALLPAVMHLLWATGATTGLSADRIAERSTDFHLVEGVHTLFAVVAVVGTSLLVLRLRAAARLSTKIPLAGAWVGSGTLGCWGGFLFLTTLMPTDPDQRAAGPMVLTYAVSMVAGFLLLSGVVSVLRRRAA